MKKITLILLLQLLLASRQAQWLLSDKGLPPKANIKGLASFNGTLFAAASEGLFVSTDNGGSWEKKNLNDKKASPYLQCVTVAGDSLLAGGSDNVYVSADKGASWNPCTQMPRSQYYEKIIVSGFKFYFGCYHGLYYSFNKGIYWDEITAAIKRETFMDDEGDDVKVKTIRHIVLIGKDLYVGTSSGIYVSNNNGKTWEARNEGLPKKHYITYFNQIGDRFFCSTGDGLYVSSNQGKEWTKAENTLPKNTTINTLVGSGNNLYAAVWQKGIYKSTDGGATWEALNTGLPKKFNAWSLLLHEQKLCAGAVSGGFWMIAL